MKNRMYIFSSTPSHKKTWNPEKYSFGVGQFFDVTSYTGMFRHAILGLLLIFFGRYGDIFFMHQALLLGRDVAVPTPGKIQWHERVSLIIGSLAIIVAILNFYAIYKNRKDNEVVIGDSFQILNQKYPLVHDLIFGWPFLLALPLIYYAHPVDALYGILFGGIAYALNHYISKASRIPVLMKIISNLSFGSLAIWGWFRISITSNGFPEGWQDIPRLPIF